MSTTVSQRNRLRAQTKVLLVLLCLFTLLACSSKPHSVTLSWTPSPSPYVLGYFVYRASTPGQWTKLTPTVVHATGYVDHSVKSGQVYRYRVTTLGPGFLESLPSEEIEATVPR